MPQQILSVIPSARNSSAINTRTTLEVKKQPNSYSKPPNKSKERVLEQQSKRTNELI